MAYLANQHVVFAKRLLARSAEGLVPSLSVMLCFESSILPSVVHLGYIRFRTRIYRPPPVRCFKCNLFGHISKHCRGHQRCTKCGSRDHSHSDCKATLSCSNCGGSHSAAYGGCPRYREEAKIQAVKSVKKMSYADAAGLVRAQRQNSVPFSYDQREFPVIIRPAPIVQVADKSSNVMTPTSQPPPSLSGDDVPSTSNSAPHRKRPKSTDITIDSLRFFSFITAVVQKTVDLCRQGKDINVASIVSMSAVSFFGYNLDCSILSEMATVVVSIVELKTYVSSLKPAPDVIAIQESHLVARYTQIHLVWQDIL